MIRAFKPEDTDTIVAIWRSASDLAHPFLTKEFQDREAENVRHVYLAFAETWVAEVDCEPVGFIALVDNEIGGLFLDPACHGKGIGRAMVEKAVSEKGPLTVEVFVENTIGRRFYDAFGFIPISESFHEASGHETIRMVYTPDQSR